MLYLLLFVVLYIYKYYKRTCYIYLIIKNILSKKIFLNSKFRFNH